MIGSTLTLGQRKSHFQSELFTVRMWRELIDDHIEWRGKVLHSGSRKKCYFREWEALAAFIQQVLADEMGGIGFLTQ
jgi:hypothetical protein